MARGGQGHPVAIKLLKKATRGVSDLATGKDRQVLPMWSNTKLWLLGDDLILRVLFFLFGVAFAPVGIGAIIFSMDVSGAWRWLYGPIGCAVTTLSALLIGRSFMPRSSKWSRLVDRKFDVGVIDWEAAFWILLLIGFPVVLLTLVLRDLWYSRTRTCTYVGLPATNFFVKETAKERNPCAQFGSRYQHMKRPYPQKPSGVSDGTIWFGGPIRWFSISLIITGDDLNPDQVTQLFGVLPTRAHKKDRANNSGRWHRPTDTQDWHLGISANADRHG